MLISRHEEREMARRQKRQEGLQRAYLVANVEAQRAMLQNILEMTHREVETYSSMMDELRELDKVSEYDGRVSAIDWPPARSGSRN